jgi:hypothetical protein
MPLTRARVAVSLASLLIRHAFASFATIAAACAIWTVTYVGLLLWAIVSNEGLGGPLAYPGGLLFIGVAAAVSCLLLFFPATVSAEWICRSRALPILAQIPIAVVVLAVLCLLAGVALRVSTVAIPFGASVRDFIAWLFFLSLLPIGFYWWIAQAAPLLSGAVYGR